MTRQRRDFPEDFKRDAVALVTEQGYSIAEASRSLDIGSNLLGRWKREYEVVLPMAWASTLLFRNRRLPGGLSSKLLLFQHDHNSACTILPPRAAFYILRV